MIDIDVLFPDATEGQRAAFEAAPRTLPDVSAKVDYREALRPDDPRYEPTTRARGESFERRFFRALGYRPDEAFQPPEPPKHALFFGHVGCGKSTELRHLCKELHHPDRYWVVRVDVLGLIDSHDARYSDIWLAVAQELVRHLQKDDVAVTPVVLDRLERWFSERVLSHDQVRDFSASMQTKAALGGGLPLVGKLLAEFTSALKTASTHRTSIRTVVQNTYAEFADALNQLIVDVSETLRRTLKGRQLLFAIDGTDRLRQEDWMRLFVQDVNQLTQIRCIAVYTAPMALNTCGERLDLFERLMLPMIKLREISADGLGERRAEAYRTMRAIVLKRCHHTLIDTVETLDLLIERSGGHLRDALRLLYYACIEADDSVLTAHEVREAAKRLAGEYRAWLQPEHYAVLAQAERHPEDHGTGDAVTMLVERGALLEYNSGTWRLPHPVVTALPGYLKAKATTPPAVP